MAKSKVLKYLSNSKKAAQEGSRQANPVGKVLNAGSKAAKYVSGASGVGQQGSKLGEALNLGQAPFKLAGSVATDGVVAAAKGYNKVMPMTKKTDPNIGNLWTGRREGRGTIAAAGVIGAGYMGYSSMKQTTFAPRVGEVSYGGTAPIMDADGVGSRSQAPTLGAGGNMVFGLHNARKG